MTATITIPKIVTQMPRFSRTWVNHWMMHYTTVSHLTLSWCSLKLTVSSSLAPGALDGGLEIKHGVQDLHITSQKFQDLVLNFQSSPKNTYIYFTLFDFPFIKFRQNIESELVLRSKIFCRPLSHFDEQVSVQSLHKSLLINTGMLVSVPAPVSPAALITMHRIHPLLASRGAETPLALAPAPAKVTKSYKDPSYRWQENNNNKHTPLSLVGVISNDRKCFCFLSCGRRSSTCVYGAAAC